VRRIALASTLLLLVGESAAASTSWSLISFATTPANAPQILAAADKLLSSPAGKEFPGRLLLQAHQADGANPATHSFAPIYESAAQREAFVEKLQKDPAWTEFQATLAQLTQPVSVVQHRTLKSWGKIEDTDKVWAAHAFDVRDAGAFAAALDAFMKSAKGKAFPGQVHLSQVVAGGLSPVSHVISVGFASEAEMETWNDSLDGNADWNAYLAASQASSEYLGGNLSRDLKAWGPASLEDLAVP
jgi:hypothetical protein